ncbi:methyltransferase domain-containing protein [Ideonella sp. 4Y16]|uniref:methyltransferase n=1 Tax=Ideonella alba TaxID=2824118 RepID=UPI001B365BD5|nr:methyltransferase [Ideonella alba]MBQ0943382.1 methyltransferase domain-containing protein [Ideonella alba]
MNPREHSADVRWDGAPPAPWRDGWARWRDRLLGSPRFRQWAAGFPLTRWVARRRAQALFDLVAGFVYSQVLLACVQLRLFDHLAEGPRTLDALAPRLGLDASACLRLLQAAQALSLVEPRGAGRWGLGPLGAVMAGDRAISAMVEHHGALYADLADPVALLRGQARDSHLAAFWPYATTTAPGQLGDADVGAYSELMSASQPLVAEQVLDAVDLRRWRCLMDVGGGQGRFLIEAARRVPALSLRLLDLPAVVERARQQPDWQALGERARVHGADFLRQPLPTGADIVSLVRVVHDHDDEPAQALLRAVHAALPPGGALLLAEPMADTPGAARMGDAYFGFYLLAMRSGRPRSAARLAEMLQAAGFQAPREHATRQPLQTRVLMALKPGT